MFHDQSPGDDSTPVATGFAEVGTVGRFELTETEIGNGCREIEVAGELDLAVSDRLQRAIAGCRADQILISLAECRFIDSTGIALLVHAHHGEDSRVVVHSPSGQVLRILEVTGLTGNGLVFENREQALQAFVG